MDKKLKQKIKEFNQIPNYDNSKRIIVATLKPDDMALVWKDKTITFQHDDKIVTIAPNSTK
jgi:hypothetical protein